MKAHGAPWQAVRQYLLLQGAEDLDFREDLSRFAVRFPASITIDFDGRDFSFHRG
jgi:hypothetical protein